MFSFYSFLTPDIHKSFYCMEWLAHKKGQTQSKHIYIFLHKITKQFCQTNLPCSKVYFFHIYLGLNLLLKAMIRLKSLLMLTIANLSHTSYSCISSILYDISNISNSDPLIKMCLKQNNIASIYFKINVNIHSLILWVWFCITDSINPGTTKSWHDQPLQTVYFEIKWLMNLRCLSLCIWICTNNLNEVIWLVDN